MKRWIAMILMMTLMITSLTAAAGAVTEDESDGGYYIVFKGDDYRIRQRNRLAYEFGKYVIHDITLSTRTPFKIAYSADSDAVDWLYPPDGYSPIVPRYNSRWFTVEFTPEGNNGGDSSDMGWHDGYLRAYPCEPPEDDSSERFPVTDKEMKRNLYEDVFQAAYSGRVENYCDYDEIYYHDDRFGCPDWVLVTTPAKDPLDGGGYGVFDDIAVFASEYEPFTLGFGVLDLSNRTFYSITQAWNMGFEDLHDVFVHIAPQYAYSRVLGDADGDNELTVIDVTLIQRCLVGIRDLVNDEWAFYGSTHEFGPVMNYLTDYDCDGERTVIDVTMIQRHLAGMTKTPHELTASVRLDHSGDNVTAVANASFGEEPIEYCYRIEGTVYAGSVYGDDFGKFHLDNVNPEPGNFQITTGYITDSAVEIPLTSLTYNDDLTLTVRARDACGRESQAAELYFRNVY